MGVGKLARTKKISAILLVIGLMMEFWEAAKSDNEVAATKERTALLEKNNLVLAILTGQLRALFLRFEKCLMMLDMEQPANSLL
jgi:hypothetical protein